jgi:hypothetical protein
LPELELEIGIGDFEHLAAPIRLRGKVRDLSGASDYRQDHPKTAGASGIP